VRRNFVTVQVLFTCFTCNLLHGMVHAAERANQSRRRRGRRRERERERERERRESPKSSGREGRLRSMFVVKDCQGSRKTHNRATPRFSLVDPAHGHDFDVAATCPASVLIRAKWPTRVLRQREVVCTYSRFVHGSIPAASLSESRRHRWRLLPGLFVYPKLEPTC